MHREQYHYSESTGELFRRYALTVLILALSILLAFCPLASAGCACSGTSGPSSYNYLVDPEFDVNMDSFEEFAYENWEAHPL
jgi:hypothetical protein